jgi:hypothetical protein
MAGKWQATELDILRKNFASWSWEKLLEALPKRNKLGMQHVAWRMGLSRPHQGGWKHLNSVPV